MSEEGKVISFRPSEMSAGMLDDVDVVIRNPMFEMYDFEGKSESGPQPCFSFIPEVEGVPMERKQYYSCGKSDNWKPSADGFKLIAIGLAERISKRTAFGGFMDHLVGTAGFPEDKIGSDIRFLDGVCVHMAQVPTGKKADGTVRTSLLPVKWVEKGGKPASASAGKPSANVETVGGGGGDDEPEIRYAELEELIMGWVGERGGEDGLAKKTLATLFFKSPEVEGWDKAKKNAAFKVASQDAWLKSADRPWTYKDGKIQLAA
jgi:hypothetical protein